MPSPSIIVIFGITGDLSQRYLMPALYNLYKNHRLDELTEIVGVSRRDVTKDQLFEQIKATFRELDHEFDSEIIQKMIDSSSMFQMDLDNAKEYGRLLAKLSEIEEQNAVCMNRLYYLSIPPQVYSGVIDLMGDAGLNKSCVHDTATTQILVEKPFGNDLESAQKLLDSTSKIFNESQVFRIDHFLNKRGVKDFIKFRIAHPEINEIWNSEFITSVQIYASEKIDIEGRVKFYEPLGALRDFIQNHLIQILAITAMDVPPQLTSKDLHSAKESILQQVKAVSVETADMAIRGQYAGYKDEVDNNDSSTETYADLTIKIDSARWQNVPFNLWTGKALAEKKSAIALTFENGSTGGEATLNFCIQPDESITFEADGEISAQLLPIKLAVDKFASDEMVHDHSTPNAYEEVILNALGRDQTYFASKAEVLNSWRIIQPVVQKWTNSGDGLIIYNAGRTGPIKH